MPQTTEPPYYVLFMEKCGFVAVDSSEEGPGGGYAYREHDHRETVVVFATEQNARFFCTWSGAVLWVKDAYAKGLITIKPRSK